MLDCLRRAGRPMIAAMLILRAQPADVAALFFGRARVVEGDEAGAEGVDLRFLGVRRAQPSCGERLAAAELFEHVVECR